MLLEHSSLTFLEASALLDQKSSKDQKDQKDQQDQQDQNQSSFPKIIHQFWFGLESPNMPEAWQHNFDAFTALHPDYIHVLWSAQDSEDCVLQNEPDFFSTYKSFKYDIQRIDSVRYCMIKRFGGFYVDLDIEPIHSISTVIPVPDCVYVLKSAFADDFFTNAIFGAPKNSPIMTEVIEKMKQPLPWFVYGKHMTVMYSTGPAMFTSVIKKYTGIVCVLPETTMNNDYDAVKTKDTVFINAYGCSWHGYDSIIIKFVHVHKTICACFGVLLFCTLIFLAILYFKRLRRCNLQLKKCSLKK